jgi:hypothetical protein
MAASSISRIGLEHDIPIDTSGLGLFAQGGQEQRVEVHSLKRRGHHSWFTEAVEQLSLGMTSDAGVDGEHQHAALLQASNKPCFNFSGLCHVVIAQFVSSKLSSVA